MRTGTADRPVATAGAILHLDDLASQSPPMSQAFTTLLLSSGVKDRVCGRLLGGNAA